MSLQLLQQPVTASPLRVLSQPAREHGATEAAPHVLARDYTGEEGLKGKQFPARGRANPPLHEVSIAEGVCRTRDASEGLAYVTTGENKKEKKRRKNEKNQTKKSSNVPYKKPNTDML